MERSLDRNEIGCRRLNGRPKEKYPHLKTKNSFFYFHCLWFQMNNEAAYVLNYIDAASAFTPNIFNEPIIILNI
jgi:hypothetical protein